MDPAPVGDYLVKIEPTDELFITVLSEQPEASAVYNVPMINPATKSSVTQSTQPRGQTYVVDTKGDIYFPVLGKLHVQGLTCEQLRDELTRLISADIEDPIVTVDMVNYSINVIGEVNRPGTQMVYTPRYTILDAMAHAGDLNQYGRRDNVTLIREVDGVRKHVRFNLNSAEILSSPYFYLKQNDVIYVEPNNVRKDNAEYSQYYSYKLSVVSTIVGMSASIISLVIALSR